MRHIAQCATFMAAALLATVALADVKPNHLFSDHMVLQRGVAVPVWGTASPGEQVTVTFGDQKQSAIAADNGKWMIRLASLQTGGPAEMTIAGKNSITIHDVLVGEVWIGSGQSNMQFPFAAAPNGGAYNGVKNVEQELPAANYPLLRMYTVKTKLSAEPVDDTDGQWDVCTPDSAKTFSAIGYFFSRDLLQEINVPVGFIHSSFGASTAEAWISKTAMDGDPRLSGLMKNFQTSVTAFAARKAATPAAAAAPTPTPAPAAPPATLPTTQGARGRGARAARGGARGPRSPYTDQHNPTVLWNGMLNPLVPYAFCGVIWYQGESVLGGTAGDKLYPAVMETLLKSWRAAWGEGDFPFYVCQLAGQDTGSNNPIIRESQAAILTLPNTGMAVTIDIGEQHNVHPKNKQDVGDRLSRIALAKVYGQPIEYSGPVYDSMSVQGNSIRIKFTHADGLTARGGPLKTFVIAGADGKFVPATATIDGNSVVVLSPDVPNPANVRYAWMNWAEGCNLYNSASLPAAPFRTDRD